VTCQKRGCADPCFYCDAEVQRHDHDHAPIPRHAGGTETVVACPGCHNLKDRILFARWPLALAVMAVSELVELDEMPSAAVTEWPRRWDDMTSHGRLLWAKWAAACMGGIDMETRHALDQIT
jgi:hypothetical protein